MHENAVLRAAAQNGNQVIVGQLLAILPVFRAANACFNNALCVSIKHGHAMVARRLLQIPHVRSNAAVNNNYPLLLAAEKGFDDIVDDLLTIPAVWEHAAIQDNRVLETAALNGHLHIIRSLLASPSVQFTMARSNHRILHAAAINGHLDVVKFLLQIPCFLQEARIYGNSILVEVIKNNHTAVTKYFLNIPQVRQRAADYGNDLLYIATRHGNADLVNALLQIDCVAQHVDSIGNRIFKLACKGGHLPIVDILLRYQRVVNGIADLDNSALYLAAENGHVPVVRRLLTYRDVCSQIAVNDNVIFRVAVAGACTELVRLLLHWPIVQENINACYFEALKLVSRNGHLDILNELLKFPFVTRDIHSLIGYALSLSSEYGHLDIVDRLLELEQVRSNAALFNNKALGRAIEKGHKAIVRKLLAMDTIREHLRYILPSFLVAVQNGHESIIAELLQYEEVQMFVVSNGNEALRLAVYHNRENMVNTLLLLPEIQEQIGAKEHIIYRIAERNQCHNIIKALLNIPSVLLFAENFESQFGGRSVYDYVCEVVGQLEKRKTQFEEIHRHGMFDVEMDEAIRLFYALKYYIRRSNHDFQRQIALILTIPRVASILHQEITPSVPNELFQIAARAGFREAMVRLLDFPKVRRMAEEHDFYQTTQSDIQSVVGFRESGMKQLTFREQAQLERAETKYRSQIDELGGNDAFFMNFMDELKIRYQLDPAKIWVRGEEVVLPFLYSDFIALHLVGEENKRALVAYYTHPTHSAYRFLSVPNFWIDPEAQYVEVNPVNTNLRNAEFRCFIPLINLFWRAASDETQLGRKGFSVAARQEYLIGELAMLGRAHNWDKSRPIVVQGPSLPNQRFPIYLTNSNGEKIFEEYDDQGPDKPSCRRGIKQRVFRSLQDHPLFEPLTSDDFEEEIRVMILEHYNRAFRECSNIIEIAENITESFVSETALSEDVIRLNISANQINRFVWVLANKYGVLFEPICEYNVRAIFKFDISPSHIINFYNRFNINCSLADAVEQARQSHETERTSSISGLSQPQTEMAPEPLQDRGLPCESLVQMEPAIHRDRLFRPPSRGINAVFFEVTAAQQPPATYNSEAQPRFHAVRSCSTNNVQQQITPPGYVVGG